jgi:DNA-binding transcriptional MerR regulator
MKEESFDLKRLCELAGSDVTSRTVYYYIQQGLLPHAGTHGPGAKYELRHLNRLRLIKRLQREHLPLAEIRDRLKALSDEQVEQALAQEPPESTAPTSESALDYVRQVLSKGETRRSASPDMLQQLKSAAAGMRPPVGWDRSQWDRIVLTPDVELHVRRPLSREGNRQLERLLEEARRILKGGWA